MRVESNSARLSVYGQGMPFMDTRNLLGGFAVAVECYPQMHTVALVAGPEFHGVALVAMENEKWMEDLRNTPGVVVLPIDLRALMEDAKQQEPDHD